VRPEVGFAIDQFQASGKVTTAATTSPAPRRGLLWRLLSPLLPDSTRGWGVIPTAEAVVQPGNAAMAPALSAPLLAQAGSPSRCRVWRYTLEVAQNTPSRMATAKNALGDSVSITLPWMPPPAWATDAGRLAEVTSFEWSLRTVSVEPYDHSYDEDECVDNNFDPDHCKWIRRWSWVASSSGRVLDPGEPFDAVDEANNNMPTRGTFPGTQAPLNVVGKNADKVNWGLLTYHGGEVKSCPDLSSVPQCAGGEIDPARPVCVRVHVDPAGDPAINEAQRILSMMRLTSAAPVDADHPRGLGAEGWTPSRAGLELAQMALTQTVANDPKTQCGRTSAVILVTDGESNECNPNNRFWSENRPPDGCTSRTPGEYRDYPPGVSNDMWLDSKISYRIADDGETVVQEGLRTWVIGFSQDVSPCELDLTAYMGRTDASSPHGDGGFYYFEDPRLPPTDELTGDTDFTDDENRFDPAGGHYAFFANTAEELARAVESILSNFGAGDYTTAAPVVAAGSAAAGRVAFVSATRYPGWRGHLYAYNLAADCGSPNWDCTKPCGWSTTVTNPDGTTRIVRSNCVWDAGEVLSLGAGTAFAADGTATARKDRNNGLARKIYTWDPANPGTLIEVKADNLGTIRPLVGCDPADTGCPFNAEVIDFLRGNDGAGNPRAWALGAIINSTPTVVGAPEVWKQGTVAGHATFETDQQMRHQLVWVGSSDGMLHAFDSEDGAEILALVPPTKLGAQVQRFNIFNANPIDSPVGQPKAADRHIYGIANSPRFGDVWDPGSSPAEAKFRTMMYLAEGPGGTAVHAIDVTAPWGRDLNGDGSITPRASKTAINEESDWGWDETAPVTVLWTKTRADNSLVGQSWSIPALGAIDSDSWLLQMGGGWDERFALDDVPKVFHVDPLDGSLVRSRSLTNQNAGALVRNQSFADTVLWQKNSRFFAPDNLVNQGVQADLHGRLWVFEPNAYTPTILVDVGPDDPIYYPPAVAGFPTSGAQYSLYAFGSGSFYERSPNVTGWGIGTSGNHIPKLFIAVKNLTAGGPPTLLSKPLNELPGPGGVGTLGTRTMLTSAPFIFTPAEGYSGQPFALFLVYDPDAEACTGRSYAVRVNFDPANLNNAEFKTYRGGKGAAAGLAITAGGKVIAVYSFIGSQGRAYVEEVPEITIAGGGAGNEVVWWRELR
jgi:hypothetical protein